MDGGGWNALDDYKKNAEGITRRCVAAESEAKYWRSMFLEASRRIVSLEQELRDALTPDLLEMRRLHKKNKKV